MALESDRLTMCVRKYTVHTVVHLASRGTLAANVRNISCQPLQQCLTSQKQYSHSFCDRTAQLRRCPLPASAAFRLHSAAYLPQKDGLFFSSCARLPQQPLHPLQASVPLYSFRISYLYLHYQSICKFYRTENRHLFSLFFHLLPLFFCNYIVHHLPVSCNSFQKDSLCWIIFTRR